MKPSGRCESAKRANAVAFHTYTIISADLRPMRSEIAPQTMPESRLHQPRTMKRLPAAAVV